jgi:hypothetical protein
MADEVTKKDLQSLQGYVNKQNADIGKRIDKAEGAIDVLKELPTKQDEVLGKLIRDCYDKLDSRCAELVVKIDAVAGKVDALAARVKALE